MSHNKRIIVSAWVAFITLLITTVANASTVELTTGDASGGLTVPFPDGNPAGTYSAGVATSGFTPYSGGPYTYAYDLGTSGTLQGVAFTSTLDSHITISDTAHTFGASQPTGGTLGSLLFQFYYLPGSSTDSNTVTFSNLVPDKLYQVDFLVSSTPDENRSAMFTFTGLTTVSDSFVEFIDHEYDVSELVNANASGQIAVTLTPVMGVPGATLQPTFAAFAVSAPIPEPTSAILLFVGAATVLGSRRRKI